MAQEQTNDQKNKLPTYNSKLTVLWHMELKHGNLTNNQNENLYRWKLFFYEIGEMLKIIKKKQFYKRKKLLLRTQYQIT